MPQTLRVEDDEAARELRPGDLIQYDRTPDATYMVVKNIHRGETCWLNLKSGLAFLPGDWPDPRWALIGPGQRVVLEV